MIHGNSTDPVLVKKISLKIWKLRDEIESVIQNAIESSESENIDRNLITQIRQEYNLQNSDTSKSEESTQVQEGPAETESGDDALAAAQEFLENESESEEEASEENALEELPIPSEEEGETEAEDNVIPLQSAAVSNKVIEQKRPLIAQDKLMKGMSILSEINMEYLNFFCNTKMIPGQSIVIDFIVPKKFIVTAEVVNCRPYNMKSRIISENKMPYRCAARFTFLREGERTLLRQFLESIEPDVEISKNTAEISKASSKQDDDEGLGDLDDLDL